MTTCELPHAVTPRMAGAPFVLAGAAQVTPHAPAVVLERPKSEWNVALVIRACWAFGIRQVWLADDRLNLDPWGERPVFEDAATEPDYWVAVIRDPDPLAHYAAREGVRVVAVERGLDRPVWTLGRFPHPERAVYVFGPEDGSVSPLTLARADATVEIPSRHPLNLALAVGIILGDRATRLGG